MRQRPDKRNCIQPRAGLDAQQHVACAARFKQTWAANVQTKGNGRGDVGGRCHPASVIYRRAGQAGAIIRALVGIPHLVW
jgi:hypothetical protein